MDLVPNPATSASARTTVPAGKTYRVGTHRVRPPDETWEWIAPRMSAHGITRVADVTGLDLVDIPVYLAIRPASRTLAVSQGKGVTPISAKVSAVMEAIELWHAENVTPDVCDTSAAIGDLPYAIPELAEARNSGWHPDLPLDWTIGHGVESGAAVPVPFDCVRLDATFRPVWAPPGFLASSNGLASGNTVAEATAHALYEIIERDTAAALHQRPPEKVSHLDLDSVDSAEGGFLLDRFRAAGIDIRVRYDQGRLGTHVFEANGWANSAPTRFAGWGCHRDPAVALSRALTEAAQSRLTAIVGSRDDDEEPIRNPRSMPASPTIDENNAIDWRQFADQSGATLDDDIRTTAAAITAATGHEPIRVILPSPTDVPVVKIIAPGLRGVTAAVHVGTSEAR